MTRRKTTSAEELIAALSKHYPRFVSAQKPPVSSKALARFGELPAALTTLWSWKDGAEGLFLGTESEGMDWIELATSASATKMLRDIPTFPANGLACATDGAGNYLCVDLVNHTLFDWDHETRKTKVVAKTLDEYLARVAKRVVAGKFRDGHEAPAGKVDRRVSQATKLLEQSASEHQQKILELLSNATPEGAVTVLRALKRALPKGATDDLLDELARHETRAGDFRAAIATSAELGKRGGVPAMTAQGRLAWVVKNAMANANHEVVLEAFEAMAEFEESADALVGKVVALSLLGRPTADVAAKAERAITKELAIEAPPVPNPRVRAQYALEAKCHGEARAAAHRAMLQAVAKRFDEAKKLVAKGHAAIDELVAHASAEIGPSVSKGIAQRAHAVVDFDGVLSSLASAVGFLSSR